MSDKVTSETITDEQVEDVIVDQCSDPDPDIVRAFGSLARLRELALRRIGDNDARRVYGEKGIEHSLQAKAICAAAWNARYAKGSRR